MGEFIEWHDLVQSLLNEGERETDHSDWYEPKWIGFKEFLDEMEAWMNEDGSAENAELNPVPNVELNAVHDAGVGLQDSIFQVAQKASDMGSDKFAGGYSTNIPRKTFIKTSGSMSKASSKKSR